jgi:hypothetical protein
VNPIVNNLCQILCRYQKITASRFSTNCCANYTPGVFGQDFGISNVIYKSCAACDDTCGNLDECKLNQQISDQYLNECNQIVCNCDKGIKICENVEVISQGNLKISWIIWYKICDKINYDVYFSESQCVSCNPCYPPCLTLCFYNSVFGDSCDDCYKAQKKAISIATQLLCC